MLFDFNRPVMKALLAITLSFTLSTLALAQKERQKPIRWNQWLDSAAFFSGPNPLVIGKGKYSDSIASVNNVGLAFVSDDGYYLINSTADYYLWFTRRFEFLFNHDIYEYEFYYALRDSLGMSDFIRRTYNGRKLPLKFRAYYDPNETSSRRRVSRQKNSALEGSPNTNYVNNRQRQLTTKSTGNTPSKAAGSSAKKGN